MMCAHSGCSLLLVAGVIGAVSLWNNELRVRERATRLSRDLCRRRELQFLDDTVVMSELHLWWNMDGRPSVERQYCFDFSPDGAKRSNATVTVREGQVTITFPGETRAF